MTVNSFPHVARELRIRGKTLRSRVYLPAHQPGLADDGLPGERYIAYHRRRARAGLGMQITGATPIIWSDVWADGLTLVNIDDRIVPGYRRLAAAVHEEGGLMLAQLAHVGAMETAGDAVVSASGVRSEITQRTAREASADELAEILEAYRGAARRCREGELDGVEVTMAHGMLLASFLSPLMNRRQDRYGGDREGRTLYPREVVAAVREEMGPEAIIGVRIPGDELVDGGVDAQEAAAIAQTLVRERPGRLCQRHRGQQYVQARARRSLAADAGPVRRLSPSVARRPFGCRFACRYRGARHHARAG